MVVYVCILQNSLVGYQFFFGFVEKSMPWSECEISWPVVDNNLDITSILLASAGRQVWAK